MYFHTTTGSSVTGVVTWVSDRHLCIPEHLQTGCVEPSVGLQLLGGTSCQGRGQGRRL